MKRLIHFTEASLRRVTTETRAAEITGDLIEQYPASASQFSLAFCRVFLSFTWRWIAAVPLALLSLFACNIPFGHFVSPWLQQQTSAYKLSHHAELYVLFLMTGFNIALWSLASLSAVRYGLRDRITVLTGISAAIELTVLCLMPVTHFSRILPCCLLAGFVLLLTRSALRRHAIVILLGMAVYAAPILVPVMLDVTDRPAPLLYPIAWIAAILAQAYVLAKARTRLQTPLHSPSQRSA